MRKNFRLPARRRMLPTLDTLEERALLNASIPHMRKGAAASAELSAMDKKGAAPIVPNLPSMPNVSVSTVPASGDVNPYGLALVPNGFPSGGLIHAGQFLVSNFNNSTNTQGTGTTISIVTPGQNPATAPVFFNSSAVGLTEALGVLKSGFVIVGNVPTTDGKFDTIGPGELQVIDRNGTVVLTLSNASTGTNLFDGPWALTVNDSPNRPQVFVSNVESGTITRIDFKVVRHKGQTNLQVVSMTQIASGYLVQPNSAAVIVGPGGLAYNSKTGTLYVAATGDNKIFAIAHANKTNSDNGTGSLVFQNSVLSGPIGLALAPNGDLLTTNDDAVNTNVNPPSLLIEFTPTGQFVGDLSLDPAFGAAFQVLALKHGKTTIVATVNDDTNKLDFRATNT